jgi:hypothetical protein
MKIEDNGNGTMKVWVRQSWLNDLMICPERSRFGITMPEWRQSSDATHIGTAVHAGIEHILLDNPQKDGVKVAMENLHTLIDTEPFKFNSTKDQDEMEFHVGNMMATFCLEILPQVKLGGMVEKTFATKLADFQAIGNDVELWLSGTIDYIEPDGTLWDWKTAARKYSQGEKQRQSIQGSAYACAAVQCGWADDYPIRFNYGVMTRAKKSVGQIVPITRTKQHVDWLIMQATNAVQSLMVIGTDKPWMANDQHGLCSEKWCPYWSICKGSRISDQDNTLEEIL